MKYVISGSLVSGVTWMHKVMNELDSKCGLETVFGLKERRAAFDEVEGDASWLAVPRIESLLADSDEEVRVLQVVRNPLEVLRGLVQHQFLRRRNNPYDIFAANHLPDVVTASDHLGRLMYYVAEWDRPLQTVADAPVLRVDDPEFDATRLGAVFEYLTGKSLGTADLERAMSNLRPPDRVRTRGRTVSWRDVRQHQDGQLLIARAEEFGYPVG